MLAVLAIVPPKVVAGCRRPSDSDGQKITFGVLNSFDIDMKKSKTPRAVVGTADTVLVPTASEKPPLAVDTRMGKASPLSKAQVLKDNPTCLRLLVQLIRCARALARANAGSNIAARMAIMAITTSNSINVNAPIFLRRFFIVSAGLQLLLRSNSRRTLAWVQAANPVYGLDLAMPVPHRPGAEKP